jgi:hypothetical protein
VILLCSAIAWAGVSWTQPPRVDGGTLEGEVQLAEATDAPDILLDGEPIATRAVPVESDGTTLLVSIDASGSFRPHYARSLELIAPLEELVDPGFAIGTMVFGRKAITTSPTTEPAAFRADVEQIRTGEAVQQETRLAAFLLAGIDAVADARPSDRGLRRLVVFTDAGEESSVFSADDVLAHANARRVRIDVVVFARERARSYAEDLDRMVKIARGTGGTVIEVHGGAVGDRALVDRLARPSGRFRVSGEVCGDGLHAVAVRAGVVRSPEERVEIDHPCGAHVPAGSGGQAGVPAPSDRGSLDRPGSRLVGLICLLIMLGGFVGLSAVALWFARRNAEPASPAPPGDAPPPPDAALPPPPAATSSPEPPPVVEKPVFSMKLPECHLVAVGGDVPTGSRWRFTGRILRFGALPEDNDVVLDLPQVSGHHARFELFPSGAVFVEDLGSSNGTFVGDARLSPGERREVPNGVQVSLSSQLHLIVDRPDRSAQEPA